MIVRDGSAWGTVFYSTLKGYWLSGECMLNNAFDDPWRRFWLSVVVALIDLVQGGRVSLVYSD